MSDWLYGNANAAQDAVNTEWDQLRAIASAARAYQIARAEGVPERYREAYRLLDARLVDYYHPKPWLPE